MIFISTSKFMIHASSTPTTTIAQHHKNMELARTNKDSNKEEGQKEHHQQPHGEGQCQHGSSAGEHSYNQQERLPVENSDGDSDNEEEDLVLPVRGHSSLYSYRRHTSPARTSTDPTKRELLLDNFELFDALLVEMRGSEEDESDDEEQEDEFFY